MGLFMISMMTGVLGADYSGEAAEVAESAVTWVSGILGTLLTPLFAEKEMLTRVFFALLLGMIIYSIISVMFKDSGRGIKWGITGAITALALMGLPSEFLEVVRTQYGAMGAAILTVIPFIIIMAFSLRVGNRVIARITWLLYAMYYFAMFAYVATIKGGFFTTESMPYGIAFFVGIIIFFGIGQIRNLLFKGELEGLVEKAETAIEKNIAVQKLAKKSREGEVGAATS